jgi:predicted nucleic acid-binding protein
VKSFVVDASVGAKWFLPATGEPLASEAQEVLDHYTRGQIRILVPHLFWAELGSVLWKAAMRGRITQPAAEASITKAQRLGLMALPTVNLLAQALGVGFAAGRSVYDSIYVAAAMAERVQLLTADERLVNATGARFPVRWLGALPSIL